MIKTVLPSVMSSQLRGVGERVTSYIRIRKRETPELRLSGVSSTAAAAPNSESATSNFIVLRARCRRCVADTQRESEQIGRTAHKGEAFQPQRDRHWAAQRNGAVAFTAIFGLLEPKRLSRGDRGTGTSW